MSARLRRMWPLMPVALAVLGLGLWAGCSKVDLVGPDEVPPTGTQITDPADGSSVNSSSINIRGLAEVGATVSIYVNGEFAGSAVSFPAVPPIEGLGRFTANDVNLGEEGAKVVAARATDLYGNQAIQMAYSTIWLDLTPPSIAFETIEDASWKEDQNLYETGRPQVTVIGWTDTTASHARLRWGINEFVPSEYEYRPEGPPSNSSIDPPRGGHPEADIRFKIPVASPDLTAANPDSIVTYYLEVFDVADNFSSIPVTLSWKMAGKDTVLKWDDGDYGSTNNTVTGQRDMNCCVMFQAPVWANFVTEIHYYVMNDNITDPVNPQSPTTKAFTANIWRPDSSERPGVLSDIAKDSGERYDEEAWLELKLDNPQNITDDTLFPDKKFFAGMTWEFRNNPIFGIDTDEPIDLMSYRHNWTAWVRSDGADYMIRAVVSDVESQPERARTAIIEPVSR